MPAPRKKNKSPPIMSHEFILQNHADILACIAIVVVMGLMSEKTARFSKLFVFLQYGVKNENETESDIEPYSNEFERGFFDMFTVVFAALMIAVFHAVVQEYGIDKYSRRLHLSKTKTSKFNESGQLIVWCIISAIWGLHDLYQAGFHADVQQLWKGYPHHIMKWENKLFFITQIGYWLHLYPELYFLRVRKEEIPFRIQYYSLHLAFIIGAYVFHFWKVAIVLLTLHYVAEGLFHASRLFYYADKTEQSALGFSIWRIVFVAARLATIGLAALTFFYGLASLENRGFDPATGNFNTVMIRTTALASLVISQVWLLYLFVGLLQRRAKEEEQVREAIAAAEAKARAKAEAVYDDEPPKAKKTPKSKKSKANAPSNGLTTRSAGKLKKN